MSSNPYRVAIAGLGSVGANVVRLIQEQADLIRQRTGGRGLDIRAVSARQQRNRGLNMEGIAWESDPLALARRDDVDCVVEVIGGADDPAHALAQMALTQGKAVVTANKAMIATHGQTLATLAATYHQALMFEAAVAGGVPVVKTLAEGLSGNRIETISGILNGTCNYILSTMAETGAAFEDVLAEAQRLGYAEAEPSLDIDGLDTAHKLAILASLAFGCAPHVGDVLVEGIRPISALDIAAAADLGYVIRLLGIARLLPQGLSQRVYPCLLPKTSSYASIQGVTNAVAIRGDYAGPMMIQGYGAGGSPTASAVVADLIDLANGRQRLPFNQAADRLVRSPAVPMTQLNGHFYVRLLVDDHPGVVADLAGMLSAENISIERLRQQQLAEKPGAALLVLTTHQAGEHHMLRAQNAMSQRDYLLEPPVMIRVENL